jgi:beta-lactamase class A
MTRVEVALSEIRLEDTLKEDVAYGMERLIPGSLWVRGRLLSRDTMPVRLDVEAVMDRIAAEVTEGRVDYTGAEVATVEPRVGFGFDREELRKKLVQVSVGVNDAIIQVSAEVKRPKKTAEEMVRLGERMVTARAEALEVFRGTQLSVMAMGMDGSWVMGLNQDRVYTSASTYKLFVAYAMLKQVDEGRLGWGEQVNGMSLEACLETMIVNSDNACPEAWLVKLGYNKVNAMARELGLENTAIRDGNMTTTARDLSAYLWKLGKGELLAPETTEKLLGLMKRQKYRDGIPAGVGASVVADKVGFLGGLLHDAAIVYDDRGDWILVVMTNGSSWSNIARVAGVVERNIN